MVCGSSCLLKLARWAVVHSSRRAAGVTHLQDGMESQQETTTMLAYRSWRGEAWWIAAGLLSEGTHMEPSWLPTCWHMRQSCLPVALPAAEPITGACTASPIACKQHSHKCVKRNQRGLALQHITNSSGCHAGCSVNAFAPICLHSICLKDVCCAVQFLDRLYLVYSRWLSERQSDIALTALAM